MVVHRISCFSKEIRKRYALFWGSTPKIQISYIFLCSTLVASLQPEHLKAENCNFFISFGLLVCCKSLITQSFGYTVIYQLTFETVLLPFSFVWMSFISNRHKLGKTVMSRKTPSVLDFMSVFFIELLNFSLLQIK